MAVRKNVDHILLGPVNKYIITEQCIAYKQHAILRV
jgi:hypothetical protein